MTKKRPHSVLGPRQLSLPLHDSATNTTRAGMLARKDAVRESLTQALAGCGMSREEVAAEMTRLTGESVSRNHIDNWCSDAKREWRFPLEFVTAFCQITGNYALIEAVLTGTGQRLADERTIKAARLGVLAVERKKLAREERELFGELS